MEVTPLQGALPYGLISGWRRLAALRALHAETGEPRFATVQALVRRPETAAAAYVAMVEENEIRLGLSQYERARVAALAAERGRLSHRGRRRCARSSPPRAGPSARGSAPFLALYHALDGVLRCPGHLPERLGLKLVETGAGGRGGAHRRGAAGGGPAAPPRRSWRRSRR